MKLKLTIDLDSSTFEVEGRLVARDGHDIAWCLREVAQTIDGMWAIDHTDFPVRDPSGNRVGNVEITAE